MNSYQLSFTSYITLDVFCLHRPWRILLNEMEQSVNLKFGRKPQISIISGRIRKVSIGISSIGHIDSAARIDKGSRVVRCVIEAN